MKMYVKPSINVIELQLKENIAAVPTTVYKGSKANGYTANKYDIALNAKNTGLAQKIIDDYGLSLA